MTSNDAIRPASDGSWGVSINGSDLVRYPPEPRNTAGTWIQSATNALTGALSGAAGGIFAPGGFAASGDFAALLAQQVEVQKVMQTVNMQSNIERSKHETEMAPIRNLRVG